MRAVTTLVSVPADSPLAGPLGAEAGLRRERIYNLNLLEDGTMVLLGRVSGNVGQLRTFVERRLDVISLSVSADADDGGLLFVHARPPPVVAEFLALPREHEVVFDFPIEAAPDGRLKVVMIGETNERLQAALEDVPPGIGLTVERIGPYLEDPMDVRSLLTDRQREVLDAAVDLGYYEVPRRATHRDVADELGITAGTVGEHLQKIEARVLGVSGSN